MKRNTELVIFFVKYYITLISRTPTRANMGYSLLTIKRHFKLVLSGQFSEAVSPSGSKHTFSSSTHANHNVAYESVFCIL